VSPSLASPVAGSVEPARLGAAYAHCAHIAHTH
jgi:hypothetical protein